MGKKGWDLLKPWLWMFPCHFSVLPTCMRVRYLFGTDRRSTQKLMGIQKSREWNRFERTTHLLNWNWAELEPTWTAKQSKVRACYRHQSWNGSSLRGFMFSPFMRFVGSSLRGFMFSLVGNWAELEPTWTSKWCDRDLLRLGLVRVGLVGRLNMIKRDEPIFLFFLCVCNGTSWPFSLHYIYQHRKTRRACDVPMGN